MNGDEWGHPLIDHNMDHVGSFIQPFFQIMQLPQDRGRKTHLSSTQSDPVVTLQRYFSASYL